MGTSCRLELYLHSYWEEQDQYFGPQRIILHQYLDAHPSNIVPDLILFEREVAQEKNQEIERIRGLLSKEEISRRRHIGIYDLASRLLEKGYASNFEVYDKKTKLYVGCNSSPSFVYTIRIKEKKDDNAEWFLKIQYFRLKIVLPETKLDQINIKKMRTIL